MLHMFQKGKQYIASMNNDESLVLRTGVFELNLQYNTSTKTWMNPKEDVQFKFVGEAEHY